MNLKKAIGILTSLSLGFCVLSISCSRKQQQKPDKTDASPSPTSDPYDNNGSTAEQGFNDNFNNSKNDLSPPKTSTDAASGMPRASFVLVGATDKSPAKDRIKTTWVDSSSVAKDKTPSLEVSYKQTGSKNGEFLFSPKAVLTFNVTGKTAPCKITADSLSTTEQTFNSICEN